MTEKCFAFIFARGGSKGVKGKNKRLLGGKPLIAHSIETALACSSISRVFVSTDSDELAEIASSHGAEVPFMRPPELASDKAPEWLAWQHAVQQIRQTQGQFDIFVSLPPTSPLRSTEDVEHCITALDNTADIVITYTDAARNPYFNMLKISDDGLCERVCTLAEGPVRRQDAPEVFDMTTVAYVARPDFIMSSSGVFDGRMKGCHIPFERAVDIDTELDFELAELLIRKRNGNA